MASRSKLKGNRGENKIVALCVEAGYPAHRVPLSGAAGGEFSGDVFIDGLLNRRIITEVKSRSSKNIFWKKIKDYLTDNDALFLIEDRHDPLIVVPLSTFFDMTNENN